MDSFKDTTHFCGLCQKRIGQAWGEAKPTFQAQQQCFFFIWNACDGFSLVSDLKRWRHGLAFPWLLLLFWFDLLYVRQHRVSSTANHCATTMRKEGHAMLHSHSTSLALIPKVLEVLLLLIFLLNKESSWVIDDASTYSLGATYPGLVDCADSVCCYCEDHVNDTVCTSNTISLGLLGTKSLNYICDQLPSVLPDFVLSCASMRWDPSYLSLHTHVHFCSHVQVWDEILHVSLYTHTHTHVHAVFVSFSCFMTYYHSFLLSTNRCHASDSDVYRSRRWTLCPYSTGCDTRQRTRIISDSSGVCVIDFLCSLWFLLLFESHCVTSHLACLWSPT